MNVQFLKHFVAAALVAAVSFSASTTRAEAAKNIAKLKYSPEFILKAILEHKSLEFRPEVPLPTVVASSESDLKSFQDDVEPQWGQRPDEITNVFVVHKNKIYISDEKAYYDKTERCMDDSMAHELTHYIQVKYRGWSLNDDSLEWDAIDTQTWFREKYCSVRKP